MNPNEMMSVEEALDCVLSHVVPLEVETVSLLDAVGRVVAEDLISDCDITPFDHAAMDGFAVRAADLANASEDSPVSLQVVGEVPAGSVFNGEIGFGETARIMTGASVPDGADAVVKSPITLVVTEGRGAPFRSLGRRRLSKTSALKVKR